MTMQDGTRLYYKRNLYILSATIFLSSISYSQIAPFLPLFLKDLGVKDHLLKWSGVLFAVQSVASIIAMPFWGKMGDKYGRKPMTIRAGLCLVGIYFGMYLCSAPWHLMLLRFLNGALTGFVPGSMALIATNTPKEHAPRAVATSQTAHAVGAIIGPPLGGVLAAIFGYKGSMIFSASAVMLCTIAIWFWVKEINKPEIKEETSLAEDFRTALRSPIISSIMVAGMATTVFSAAITPMLAIHLANISHGINDTYKGIIFSLLSIAFALSAHRWSRYGERKGPQKAIRIGLTGTVVCALALAAAPNVWLFGVVFFMAGIFLAATSPSCATIICQKVDQSFQARAYGMMWSASTVSAMIVPLAVSPVGDAFGTPSIFVMVAAVTAVGILPFQMLVRSWGKNTGAATPVK